MSRQREREIKRRGYREEPIRERERQKNERVNSPSSSTGAGLERLPFPLPLPLAFFPLAALMLESDALLPVVSRPGQ